MSGETIFHEACRHVNDSVWSNRQFSWRRLIPNGTQLVSLTWDWQISAISSCTNRMEQVHSPYGWYLLVLCCCMNCHQCQFAMRHEEKDFSTSRDKISTDLEGINLLDEDLIVTKATMTYSGAEFSWIHSLQGSIFVVWMGQNAILLERCFPLE